MVVLQIYNVLVAFQHHKPLLGALVRPRPQLEFSRGWYVVDMPDIAPQVVDSDHFVRNVLCIRISFAHAKTCAICHCCVPDTRG